LGVGKRAGAICAWLSLNTFYGRPAYNATVEISLYVHQNHQRNGFGKRLLEHAIDEAPTLGINCIVALIFAHNPGSLKLFRSRGFDDWGLMPKIAHLNDKDCDLVILGRHL